MSVSDDSEIWGHAGEQSRLMVKNEHTHLSATQTYPDGGEEKNTAPL